MRTDTVLKNEGMSILVDKLGKVEAERFIMLINKEPFDYTEWRGVYLDNKMSVEELSAAAMESFEK